MQYVFSVFRQIIKTHRVRGMTTRIILFGLAICMAAVRSERHVWPHALKTLTQADRLQKAPAKVSRADIDDVPILDDYELVTGQTADTSTFADERSFSDDDDERIENARMRLKEVMKLRPQPGAASKL